MINEIPIVKVAEALGLEVRKVGGRFYIRCPVKQHEHDAERPGCQLGGEKNLAHCF